MTLRMLSLMSVLVACLTSATKQSLVAQVGSPQVELEATADEGAQVQAEEGEVVFEAFEATVGEYSAFTGILPWIRFYTNPLLDSEEARSTRIRCFHRLGELDPQLRQRAFNDLRSGHMHLASRVNDVYYVVESVGDSEIRFYDGLGQSIHGMDDHPEQALQLIADGTRTLQQAPAEQAQNWYTQALERPQGVGVVQTMRADSLVCLARKSSIGPARRTLFGTSR